MSKKCIGRNRKSWWSRETFGEDEKKLLSRILCMPSYSKCMTYENKTKFVEHAEKMAKGGEISADEVTQVKDVFEAWWKSGCRNAKTFVMQNNLTEEQMDILFRIWKSFEPNVLNYYANNYKENTQEARA